MKKDNNKIPVYDICSLQKEENRRKDDVLIEAFAPYLQRHPNLKVPHRHSFYHVVFFTAGSGSHTIDFEQFHVKPGQIYFMIPGQVHSWQFNNDTDGYIVNFSEDFLRPFLREDTYTERFPFLQGVAAQSVINLPEVIAAEARRLLITMLEEAQAQPALSDDRIRLNLLELFILAARESNYEEQQPFHKSRDLTLRHFRKLVDQHFQTLRLPKEYAALLYITPNHLNALCSDMLNKPAGEVIRDRILLEAKRLLVNADLSISEIAWHLNFADNSYFTKFFRKQTGATPEAFRQSVIGKV